MQQLEQVNLFCTCAEWHDVNNVVVDEETAFLDKQKQGYGNCVKVDATKHSHD